MLLLAPAVVLAQGTGPLGWNDPNAGTSGLSNQTAVQIVTNVAYWILGILAAVAILMIIVGGIMYLTSAGNEDRVATAKKIIVYAIVGVVIALVALVIVRLIQSVVVTSTQESF
jgi:hypothetical protein